MSQAGPHRPLTRGESLAAERETTPTGEIAPAGQRRFWRSGQALALVSQKILSICAM
jgi:hypothetical protein